MYKDKVLELFKNGYLSTKDVVDQGIPRIYLTNLVKKGVIVRLSRGLYIKKEYISNDFVVVQNRSKYAFFSNVSALYLHKIIDRIPIKYDVTVPSGYKGSLQSLPNVNLYYVKRELHSLGLTEVSIEDGSVVKTYDLERTICDVIKNRNNLDVELVNKAVRAYYYSNEKDVIKLYDYAKKLNIYSKVRSYFEVLR